MGFAVERGWLAEVSRFLHTGCASGELGKVHEMPVRVPWASPWPSAENGVNDELRQLRHHLELDQLLAGSAGGTPVSTILTAARLPGDA